MIEITQEQIDRVHSALSNIAGAPEKVFYRVINRTLATIRTHSGRNIRQSYRIKQRDITDNQNMTLKQAGVRNLVGEIKFAGSVIPLIKFNVTPTVPQRKMVSAAVYKNSGKEELVHAFVANLGKYGVGVFQRQTEERDSSKQLYGPATGHMMQNEDVLNKVDATANETIDKRIDHEIKAILSGYGVKEKS
ncbi:MAG: phage tail protein [Clostridiales bacterium]|jgi:hypothetical protein|nr:phage tail protein [Clostridiales bacterium]